MNQKQPKGDTEPLTSENNGIPVDDSLGLIREYEDREDTLRGEEWDK